MIESKYLKDDMKNIQQLFAIPSLKSFETRDLSRLLILSKIRQYDNGEAIIEEGGLDRWIYFLLSGKVRISKGALVINTLHTKGDIFGEMRLLDGLSRSASVYSVGKTICLSVDISAKDRLASEHQMSSLLRMLYKVVGESMSVRLRLANNQLVCAKTEISKLEHVQLGTH